MGILTAFVWLLGVAVVLLLVWGRRQREEARVHLRQLAALEVERDVSAAERTQLVSFIAGLTAAAGRLFAAASEREIPGVLLEATVAALTPATTLVGVRRRRVDGAGRRFVVAAVHPREASVLLGADLSWPEMESGTGSGAVRRRGEAALPSLVVGTQSAPETVALEMEWAVPMRADSEAVGLIALSATACAPALAETMLEALARVGAVAFSQAAARQRTRTNAQVDELTLLFNRRHILRVLSEEVYRCQQQRHELSVFLFDVDHFKRYNDINGHMAGDLLLRLLADFVLKNVRASDTVGRFGGEEFLLILPHSAAVQAIRVANGLRSLIAGHEFPARAQQPLGAVTVSGGVAQFPVHGASVSTLLRAADQALYCAKRDGRNRVVCADTAPLDVHYESADLEEELD